MKRNFMIYFTTLFIGACSPVNFQGGSTPSATTQGTPAADCGSECIFPGTTGINGISGGHFDLDTSTQVYPFSKGTTNHHVHEYDKAYQTTIINFFNLIDTKFNNIQTTLPAGKKFYLNLVNSNLSPGGALEINGVSKLVGSLQNSIRNQVYVIGPASAGEVSLASLRLGFAPDIISQGGLVPTVTGCVRSNDPGKLGEYRSGALTVQALDLNYQLDPKTGAASSGLLWEATVFWHWDGPCY